LVKKELLRKRFSLYRVDSFLLEDALFRVYTVQRCGNFSKGTAPYLSTNARKERKFNLN
jgi:hypothetical protein